MRTIETIKAAHAEIINTITVGQGLWCNGHHYTVARYSPSTRSCDMVFIKLTDYKGKLKTIAYDTNLRDGSIYFFERTRKVKHPIFNLSLTA